MDKIKIKANAKLNLCLFITGIRQDGYHEIDSIFQSIHLFDYITVKKASGIHLSCDDKNIPLDEKNTCYKAVTAFMKKTGVRGADIKIEKTIPVMAGLGGGSADAAAVLVGMNDIYECGLNIKQLIDIGEEIGADVPFFIQGGCQRATGIGEILEKLNQPFDHDIIVIKPKGHVSTPQAYRLFDETKNGEKKPNRMIEALIKQDEILYLDTMKNALESCAINLVPECNNAIASLTHHGAKKAMVTGSGSAVYGVFKKGSAKTIIDKIRKSGFENVFLTSKAEKGLEIISID